jgi:preprotein translocase subunit SecD
MGRQRGLLGLILALVVFSVVTIATQPIRRGLDLQGGAQLTIQVEPSEKIPNINSPEGQEAVRSVEAVISNRVNGLGVSEPLVQRVGSDRVLVQLAGVKDPYEAENLLGRTAQLEFREQVQGSELTFREKAQPYSPLLDQESALREQIKLKLKKEKDDREGLAKLVDELNQVMAQMKQYSQSNLAQYFTPSGITGSNLTDAYAESDPASDRWHISLRFNSDGGNKFAEMTKRLAGTGRTIGIFVDDTLISFPIVGLEHAQTGITGGSAIITGDYTIDTATQFSVQLKSGSLPVPIRIVENRIVGATLGQDSVQRSIYAGVGGLILVLAFMIWYYRLPGVIASIALTIYSLLNLAAMAWIPNFVLTLPGIAGFILSIGMAVDANVLIFERTREELRAGKTLYRSVESGFFRAFSSILDGNVTTVIACAALWYLGTGLVRGFALTLGIGVVISMFTAITCSRTLLFYVLNIPSLRKPEWFCPNLPQAGSSKTEVAS